MDELTKMALVGTSQYGGSVPPTDHPAFALLAGIPENDREELLLLRSGTQAVYDLAGHRPVMNVAASAKSNRSTFSFGGSSGMTRWLSKSAKSPTGILM